MTEENNQKISGETWAGAAKEFARQFGGVASLLILVLAIGQCTNCVDIYRLLGK